MFCFVLWGHKVLTINHSFNNSYECLCNCADQLPSVHTTIFNMFLKVVIVTLCFRTTTVIPVLIHDYCQHQGWVCIQRGAAAQRPDCVAATFPSSTPWYLPTLTLFSEDIVLYHPEDNDYLTILCWLCSVYMHKNLYYLTKTVTTNLALSAGSLMWVTPRTQC